MTVEQLAGVAMQELTLFAAVGFLIGGIDELLIDLAWAARAVRRLLVFRKRPRATVATLPPPAAPGRFAIFVPAWDESSVIGPMLRHMLASFGDCAVYVCTYPNDPETTALVRAIGDPRLRPVFNPRPGPTTKADALNCCWQAMLADEMRDGTRLRGVVLHDAEDVVHPDELTIFASLIDRFALIQLPVIPIIERCGGWVAGVSADEFAEHHSKTLLAREELGAAVPSAGVGCAFARDAIERVAGPGGAPFDAASLTEDYELGLKIGEHGGHAAFVRIIGRDGQLVAVKEHFPSKFGALLRQRSRWIAGIGLHGWDRLSWHGGLAERWMRARDRRTLFATLVLIAGYLTLVLWLGLLALGKTTPVFDLPPWLSGAVLTLMIWRLAIRAAFVAATYGWAQGLFSVPRMVGANLVLILASVRAVWLYVRAKRDGAVRWDKTAHIFPTNIGA